MLIMSAAIDIDIDIESNAESECCICLEAISDDAKACVQCCKCVIHKHCMLLLLFNDFTTCPTCRSVFDAKMFFTLRDCKRLFRQLDNQSQHRYQYTMLKFMCSQYLQNISNYLCTPGVCLILLIILYGLLMFATSLIETQHNIHQLTFPN
jgi:hypothetical protein